MRILRKRIFIPLFLLAVIAGGGWYFYSSHHVKQATAPNSSYVPPTSKTISTNTVTIQNYAFSPADIKVKLGTSVTWTNLDAVGYTVTEDDQLAGPASDTLKQNQTYTFKFTKAGLYHYHNSLDPQMFGTVTVE